MPAAALKSLAKKAGKSMETAEHDWNKAKGIVSKEYGFGEENPRYWALVTGITKKMMGLKEGLSFKEFLGKKKDEKSSPLTDEERKMIKRIFPECNALEKRPGRDEWLFPSNAHAVYGTGRLSFYKKGNELRVSVGHYRNNMGPGDPKISPITHTDHAATEDELERLHKELK